MLDSLLPGGVFSLLWLPWVGVFLRKEIIGEGRGRDGSEPERGCVGFPLTYNMDVSTYKVKIKDGQYVIEVVKCSY